MSYKSLVLADKLVKVVQILNELLKCIMHKQEYSNFHDLDNVIEDLEGMVKYVEDNLDSHIGDLALSVQELCNLILGLAQIMYDEKIIDDEEYEEYRERLNYIHNMIYHVVRK